MFPVYEFKGGRHGSLMDCILDSELRGLVSSFSWVILLCSSVKELCYSSASLHLEVDMCTSKLSQ